MKTNASESLAGKVLKGSPTSLMIIVIYNYNI